MSKETDNKEITHQTPLTGPDSAKLEWTRLLLMRAAGKLWLKNGAGQAAHGTR